MRILRTIRLHLTTFVLTAGPARFLLLEAAPRLGRGG